MCNRDAIILQKRIPGLVSLVVVEASGAVDSDSLGHYGSRDSAIRALEDALADSGQVEHRALTHVPPRMCAFGCGLAAGKGDVYCPDCRSHIG